jgi:hypothetical protein
MAKDNPHDIGRLLDATALSFARTMTGNLSRLVFFFGVVIYYIGQPVYIS